MDSRLEWGRNGGPRRHDGGGDALPVGPSVLASCLPETGWRETFLPKASGLAHFRCGRIAAGIAATASHCASSHPDHARIEHPHPTVMLVFGERGCTAFDAPKGGRSCVVGPGDVWLLCADEAPLLRRSAPGVDNRMAVLRFDAARLADLWGEDRAALPAAGAAMRLGRDETAHIWTAEIFDNPLTTPLDRLLAEGQALELLARWLGPLPCPPGLPCEISAEDNRRVARVVERLIEDLTAPPSLDDLAVSVEMSHVRLNRCFRKLYGTTVFGWLRNYRLERACRCLDDPRCSVTDVAFRCGFSSSSHFATAFRQRFRCSPQEYRRRCS